MSRTGSSQPRGIFLGVVLFLFAASLAHAQVTPDISTYLDSAAGVQAQSGTPSPVDLLFETDSYTPPFYQGLALASPGSDMHFLAIPHFTNGNGAAIAASSLTYTWSIDGRVQGSFSGVGRSSVVLPAPTLYGQNTVSVSVQNSDGSVYGSASLTIPAVDPSATLYLDDPLIGVEYYRALDTQAGVSGLEATFAAVPYFAPARSPDDLTLQYAWSVNGSPVQSATSTASELTLNAANSSGQAALSLTITSRSQPLLEAQGSWNILFGGIIPQ